MRKHEKSHFNSGEYPCFFKCLHMYSVALATEKIVIVPTRVGWIVVMQSTDNSTIGLSPRAWGRLPSAGRKYCAIHGSSPLSLGADERRSKGSRLRRTVYPHLCGADMWEDGDGTQHYGSSPRAWGRCMPSTDTLVLPYGSSPRAWGR